MTLNPEPINIASLTNEMHVHINQHLHDANKEYAGISIAHTRLNVIFHSFRQADLSTTRRYDGLCLDLAIARRLARLMGGDMIATSEGRGSRFVFTAGMHE